MPKQQYMSHKWFLTTQCSWSWQDLFYTSTVENRSISLLLCLLYRTVSASLVVQCVYFDNNKFLLLGNLQTDLGIIIVLRYEKNWFEQFDISVLTCLLNKKVNPKQQPWISGLKVKKLVCWTSSYEKHLYDSNGITVRPWSSTLDSRG